MVLIDNGGSGRNNTRIIAPPHDLHHLVEHISVQTGTRDVASPTAWRIVPDASPHLIFAVSRNGSRLSVVGARSHFVDIDVCRREMTVAVRFRPGALPLITRLPAADFLDRSVAVSDVFRPAAVAPLDCLEGMPADGIVRALIAFVREATTAGSAQRSDLSDAFARHGSVAAVAAMMDLPVRTVHARTRAAVGLAPKRLMRIARLHRALRLVGTSASSLCAVAARTGYADQSHLARECAALLGESPSRWLGRSAPADSSKTPATPTR